MNYLQLAQAVRSRVGLHGTGPSSISGANEAEQLILDAVRDAWIDIQNMRKDWKWMRAQAILQTTAGTTDYSVATILPSSYTRFSHWRKDTFYMKKDGSNYSPLTFVEYDNYVYHFQNNTAQNVPEYYTIKEADNSLIIQLPDDTYVFKIDYQKSAQELTTETDTPELPLQFHNVVMYQGIEKYSAAIASPEVFQKYAQDYARAIGDLMRHQLPSRKTLNMRPAA